MSAGVAAARRRNAMRLAMTTLASALLVAPLLMPSADSEDRQPRPFKAKNESGVAWTINVAGDPVVDPDNPFFQDLGTNGRRCVTCHRPAENMSVSAAGVAERFQATGGKDAIFRLVDGANSPLADVSTIEDRRLAYSMLL